MKVPLNRVVAFLGPYIAAVSGAVAAWLVSVVNVLAIPGLDQANLATWIAAAITAVVTAGLTWAGHSKWLKGHHIELVNEATEGPDPVHPSLGDVPADDPTKIPPDVGDTVA